MRGRVIVPVLCALLVIGGSLVGCSGSLRRPASPTPSRGAGPRVPPAAAEAYLAQLMGAQARLGRAESRIPVRPSSSAALAAAVTQLAGAIGRLGVDLGAIQPPGPVQGEHNALLASVERFHRALLRIAADARGSAPVAIVGGRLLATTSQASEELAGEQRAIVARLRR